MRNNFKKRKGLFRHFVLMAIFCGLMTPISLSAQKIDLSMKNVTVQEAISALNKSENYSIILNADEVDLNKRISVSAKDASINEVLDQVFAGQEVSYVIEGRRISVTKKQVQPQPQVVAQQQSTIVKGTVVDNYGEPLIGAGVLVKGTTKGGITNLDGHFEVSGVTYPVTIVASFIGYSDQEVVLNSPSDSPCMIILSSDQNYLDEVVVVGYGTQKKVNLTGAVGVVDGKELQMRPVNSAAQALQGADPSLLLTSRTGSIEGSNYNVSIRGSVSLNSGSPLILIDGIEGSLGQVNPNDIESISVLKDASACAIYGAKASAGVVLINTKSGSAGEAKITYNGRVSLSDNTTSTDFITSSYDHVTLTNEFYEAFKGYGAWTFTDDQIQMMKDRRYDVTEHPDRPWVIPDETGTYQYVYLGNFDWYDFLFKRIRPETEHNVSVRGGTDKVTYYVSGRYLYKEGIFNNLAEDIYNSFSLRSKIDAKVTKWLTYSNSLSFERMLYDYGGYWEHDGTAGNNSTGIMFNLTQNVGPMFTPWNPDGTINMYPGYMADATSPIFSGRGGVFTDGRNSNKRTYNYLTMTNRFTFDIVKGLKFITDYTYRRRDNLESYRSLPTANAYDNINKRLYINPDTSITQHGVFTNGSIYDFYKESRYYQDGHILNAFFSYDNSFGNHNVAATLGANFDDYTGSTLSITQNGGLSESLAFIGLLNNEDGTNNINAANQSFSSYRTLGFFARVNYDYMGKYLVELSGRYDGSSRFPVKQRWGFFPSASAGWRISEESFFAPLKSWWNMAKIRFSYGSLGNQQVSNYYYWDSIKTGRLNYLLNGTSYATYAHSTVPVSSDLTWETVITQNLGLDLGFFNNRLNLTADFYIRDTKNMLTEAMTLPAVYGSAAPKTNAADLRTKGYELSVSWRDGFKLAGKPFSYGVAATLGDYKTVITKYENPTKLLSDHYVGKVLGDIWGYTTGGLFSTDEEAAAYAALVDDKNANKGVYAGKAPYNVLMAGDIKFLDLPTVDTDGDGIPDAGDGVINTGDNTFDNPGDRRIIGNTRPRYNYSFRGDLQWYGIDLQIFFQGVGKVSWMPHANSIYFWNMYSYHRPTFIPKNFEEKTWSTEEGADNSKVVFPRRRGRIASSGNLVTSDYWLQNAAYIRLKNLTLGYTLPLKTKAVDKVRFYFSGENLWYWSPIKKWSDMIDPEIATSSANADCIYPYSRTFSFGVDITF